MGEKNYRVSGEENREDQREKLLPDVPPLLVWGRKWLPLKGRKELSTTISKIWLGTNMAI